MNPITIPASLVPSFGGSEQVRVCDESGRMLGYYTPLREGTDEDYQWAMNQITKEEIEASLNSGPGRPLADVIADLRRKYGP